jgi:hypothetical protein
VTVPEAHVLPTDLPYRRRIELRPSEGLVEAAMEDYMHHFGLRLHHGGGVITAVEVAPERTPWSSCGDGAAGLLRLEGTRLDAVADLRSWMGGRVHQCVHTTDLVLLAAATARRGTPRTYEILITGSFQGRRRAVMSVDGEPWADWVIVGQSVVGDDGNPRLPLGQPGFGEWVAEHLQQGSVDAEATAALRRATVIAMGRGLDMDAWTHPDDARPADGSCHTYDPAVVPVSLRNVGSCRPTEDDGVGALIREPRSWPVRSAGTGTGA